MSSESRAQAFRSGWLVPIGAALGIAVLLAATLIAGGLPGIASDPESNAAQVWPTGLHPGTLKHLRQQSHINLIPTTEPAAETEDEASAVAAAVSDFSWLSNRQVSTVNVMRATPYEGSGVLTTAVDVWAIEFDNVDVPSFGGPVSPGKHTGTMLVLIDTRTLKMLYATTD